jgi:hypothetical protein
MPFLRGSYELAASIRVVRTALALFCALNMNAQQANQAITYLHDSSYNSFSWANDTFVAIGRRFRDPRFRFRVAVATPTRAPIEFRFQLQLI